MRRVVAVGLVFCLSSLVVLTAAGAPQAEDSFTRDFALAPGELADSGSNPYFVLEPGYVLELTDGDDRLTITVLDETREIDGVLTRVVEERESEGGEVVSVSETLETLAGTFSDVLEVAETTPLDPGVGENKLYARGVGLLRDGSLKLVRYGTPAR